MVSTERTLNGIYYSWHREYRVLYIYVWRNSVHFEREQSTSRTGDELQNGLPLDRASGV